MTYDLKLAGRVRSYLDQILTITIDEKKMFGGLAFMVNGKMCINISGNNLMCRFDPKLQAEVEEKAGFKAMSMKGRKFKGYCYVDPEGFKGRKDFEYWMQLCLDFNERAKASKKKKTSELQ